MQLAPARGSCSTRISGGYARYVLNPIRGIRSISSIRCSICPISVSTGMLSPINRLRSCPFDRLVSRKLFPILFRGAFPARSCRFFSYLSAALRTELVAPSSATTASERLRSLVLMRIAHILLDLARQYLGDADRVRYGVGGAVLPLRSLWHESHSHLHGGKHIIGQTADRKETLSPDRTLSIGRLLILLASLVFLADCGGIAAKINARKEMEVSKTVYKSCLARNPQNISACDASRLSYEADIKAYRATSAGIQPGHNDTININTEEP